MIKIKEMARIAMLLHLGICVSLVTKPSRKAACNKDGHQSDDQHYAVFGALLQ